MITAEQLSEFKEIYKKEFKKDISDQEALDKATRLINLMRIIYRPMTKNQYKKYNEKCKKIANG